MSLTLFLILLIAPAFVGAIIGLLLIILEKPKEIQRKSEWQGSRFKSGDIVELKTGDVATISFVGLDFIHIRIKDLEGAKLVLEPDGTCFMLPSHSIAKHLGHADYVV